MLVDLRALYYGIIHELPGNPGSEPPEMWSFQHTCAALTNMHQPW